MNRQETIERLIKEREQIELEDIEVHKFLHGMLEDQERGIKIDRRNFADLKGQLRKNKTRICEIGREVKQLQKEETQEKHEQRIADYVSIKLKRKMLKEEEITRRNSTHDKLFIQSLRQIIINEFGKEKQYQLFQQANRELEDENNKI